VSTPESRQAVQVAQRLYRENVFPRMKITWGTYTNQLFHVNDTGCFRCHDDTHTVKGNPRKKGPAGLRALPQRAGGSTGSS
jgi:hypothetical protein